MIRHDPRGGTTSTRVSYKRVVEQFTTQLDPEDANALVLEGSIVPAVQRKAKKGWDVVDAGHLPPESNGVGAKLLVQLYFSTTC
jgi:hypothetical protein